MNPEIQPFESTWQGLPESERDKILSALAGAPVELSEIERGNALQYLDHLIAGYEKDLTGAQTHAEQGEIREIMAPIIAKKMKLEQNALAEYLGPEVAAKKAQEEREKIN